jgi:predicted ester cyclase
MTDSNARTIEVANQVLLVDGDGGAVERFFAPDYLAHATEVDLTGGPDAVRGFVATLHRAFSDLEVEVEILAEAGDRVAWQRTLRGMQSGGYAGFPATGRRVVWRDMVVTRFEGDHIAEEWVVTDLAERLLRARKG